MMVMRSNAMITLFAMFAAQWLLYMADGTVFVLDKEDHVFFFIVVVLDFKLFAYVYWYVFGAILAKIEWFFDYFFFFYNFYLISWRLMD